MTVMAHTLLRLWRWLTAEIGRGDMLAGSSPAFFRANLLSRTRRLAAPDGQGTADPPAEVGG